MFWLQQVSSGWGLLSLALPSCALPPLPPERNSLELPYYLLGNILPLEGVFFVLQKGHAEAMMALERDRCSGPDSENKETLQVYDVETRFLKWVTSQGLRPKPLLRKSSVPTVPGELVGLAGWGFTHSRCLQPLTPQNFHSYLSPGWGRGSQGAGIR